MTDCFCNWNCIGDMDYIQKTMQGPALAGFDGLILSVGQLAYTSLDNNARVDVRAVVKGNIRTVMGTPPLFF